MGEEDVWGGPVERRVKLWPGYSGNDLLVLLELLRKSPRLGSLRFSKDQDDSAAVTIGYTKVTYPPYGMLWNGNRNPHYSYPTIGKLRLEGRVADGLTVVATLLNRSYADSFLLVIDAIRDAARVHEKVVKVQQLMHQEPAPAASEEPPEPTAEVRATPPLAREEGDPLAAIVNARDRDFVRRWNAGEDSEELRKDFGFKDVHAVGTEASALRKRYPGLVKRRRNQGNDDWQNWGEDDEE